MSVLIDFSIFPMDKGESVSPYVAKALTIIKKSGLDYKLGPMSTSIEGGLEEIMTVINRCFEELKKDCDRIYMTIKADYRKNSFCRIKKKVKSVEDKL